MPKKTGPKKARWTAAQKAQAKKAKAGSGPKKPHHRGQAPSADERAPKQRWRDRPEGDALGEKARQSRSARDERRAGDRDDRRPRREGGWESRGEDRRGGYRNDRRDDRREDRRGGYRDDRPARVRRDGSADERPRGNRWEPRRDDRRGGYRDERRDDWRDERRGGYRDDRRDDSRGGHRDERRDDRRGGYRDDRRPRRDGGERPSRGRYEERREGYRPRFEREQSNRRPERYERSDAPVDHEAERMEADTWVKATRSSATGPVEVAQDNGFAALGLPSEIVERLARDGITAPFPIQEATIPDALAGRDVLGRGQTGSGKTLAFGLPTLTHLAGEKSKPRRPRALVLVPTRELAMQVSDALEPLVHVMGLRHKLVAGGLSYTGQIAALNRGIDLLIATPGRLVDLLDREAVSLDSVQITVLDEADHMADMGFVPAVTRILDEIPSGGQRLLFSATLDKGIDTLVATYLVDPVTHSTDDAQASVTTMEHHILLIDPQHKKSITAELANRDGRTVVFVRTKLGADRVARQLRESGVRAAALHGGLTQSVRNKVLGAFRKGTVPVLVATDVAARGIHVDDVSVVLQADPPADHKDYLHRAGRTARAGERGTVVTLALPHQRKTMTRMAADAGLDARPVKAAPGDAVIAATGASEPTGEPIADAEFRALLEPPRRRHGGTGGPRGSAPRRGGYGRGQGGPRRGGPGRPRHGADSRRSRD